MREIGSEFHWSGLENGSGVRFPRPGALTFSGRTAIESVLKNLPKAKTALLPSYCCDSMIEPFRKKGMKIDFYEVSYENGLKICIDKQADVFLLCNLFGFSNYVPQVNGIVIEDITHSLFSENSCHADSDYLVASVRKWLQIHCGGYCSVDAELQAPPSAFIEKKRDAMRLKTEYILDGGEEKKKYFLQLFSESNKWLGEHYADLGIDADSKRYLNCVDMEKIRRDRVRNARILYAGLQGKVEFLFDEGQMDCPLFVPILLRRDRDEVRRKLVEHSIYCPAHWPHPNADCVSNLYDWELSLVCDQRYTENDMDRIVSVLSKILK